jgi:ribosome-associated translation inhibitor RaiA
MEHSDAVETDIRNHVAKLEQLFPQLIQGCSVVVECHHHNHHQGNLFHTRIDITVPGKELVASREPGKHHAHENMHVTIRDAFAAMRRQLQQHTEKLHHKVKAHGNAKYDQLSAS